MHHAGPEADANAAPPPEDPQPAYFDYRACYLRMNDLSFNDDALRQGGLCPSDLGLGSNDDNVNESSFPEHLKTYRRDLKKVRLAHVDVSRRSVFTWFRLRF